MTKFFSEYTRTITKQSEKPPLSFHSLTEEQFNAEIEKGLASVEAGRIMTSDEVRKRMRQYYDL
jgi:DNA-damage-inducible protein J